MTISYRFTGKTTRSDPVYLFLESELLEAVAKVAEENAVQNGEEPIRVLVDGRYSAEGVKWSKRPVARRIRMFYGLPWRVVAEAAITALRQLRQRFPKKVKFAGDNGSNRTEGQDFRVFGASGKNANGKADWREIGTYSIKSFCEANAGNDYLRIQIVGPRHPQRRAEYWTGNASGWKKNPSNPRSWVKAAYMPKKTKNLLKSAPFRRKLYAMSGRLGRSGEGYTESGLRMVEVYNSITSRIRRQMGIRKASTLKMSLRWTGKLPVKGFEWKGMKKQEQHLPAITISTRGR